MHRARRAALASLVPLGLVAATVVTAGPAQADGTDAAATTVTTADLTRVSAFYASKGSVATTHHATTTGLSAAGVAPASADVGNAYYDDFAADYADDPDVQVRGLEVTSQLLGKSVVGGQTQYRVSVTVDYQLYDTYNRRAFTGGETVDHLLTLGPATSRSTAGAVTVASVSADVATADSTVAVQDETADAGQSEADSTYTVPQWQLDRKKELAAASGARATSYPQLNYSKMATYAYYWTEPKREKSINALKYGKSAGDDCTNFISQALHNGGWPIKDTTKKNRANLDYWDYNMTGPGRFTYSWSRAEESYRRVHDKAGKKTFSKLEDAWLADLVYADWNIGDSVYGDGVKDHVMIVSTVTKSRPYFSQKSGNRHNVSAKAVLKNTKAKATKWKWYGLRT